jgi:gluconolactonase
MKNAISLFFLILFQIILISKISISQDKTAVLQAEKIAGGFQFVEGPVWKDGVGLLFSDMHANTIYCWNPDSGTSVYMNPSGVSNGLAFDSENRLLLAQTGLRRIARLEADSTQTPLADNYQGKKLNSPNDISIKSDGSIFFTDPDFNIPQGQQKELTFCGIFRISPFGELQLLDSTLRLPNGICFSPDESKLYVNNSQARIIYVWDVVDDSTITNKRFFASITPNGYADGMKVDPAGNLYCTGPLGVWIYSPEGTLIDTIQVSESPSNCNWGDADRKTLYITAGTSIYKARLESTGVGEDQGNLPDSYKLNPNYPNPFNPKTTISYYLPETSYVQLKIYNPLGSEISTLVDKMQYSGSHTVHFDGSNFASGLYMYTLYAGNFTKTQKMVLTK